MRGRGQPGHLCTHTCAATCPLFKCGTSIFSSPLFSYLCPLFPQASSPPAFSCFLEKTEAATTGLMSCLLDFVVLPVAAPRVLRLARSSRTARLLVGAGPPLVRCVWSPHSPGASALAVLLSRTASFTPPGQGLQHRDVLCESPPEGGSRGRKARRRSAWTSCPLRLPLRCAAHGRLGAASRLRSSVGKPLPGWPDASDSSSYAPSSFQYFLSHPVSVPFYLMTAASQKTSPALFSAHTSPLNAPAPHPRPSSPPPHGPPLFTSSGGMAVMPSGLYPYVSV